MSFLAAPLSLPIKDNSVCASFIWALTEQIGTIAVRGGRAEIKAANNKVIDFVGKGRELLLEWRK